MEEAAPEADPRIVTGLFLAEPVPELRDYQADAIRHLRLMVGRGKRRVILCAPTGAGKTIMALHLMLAAREKGHRVAFVAERLTLVDQCSAVLQKHGIDHGIIQGQNTRRAYANIVVCSSQTIEARGMPDDIRLVIVDEAHVKRRKLLEWLRAHDDIVVVGLTATPMTDGLGETYQGIVTARTTDSLIKSGWLTPVRIFAPVAQADMTGIRGTGPGGEWTGEQAAEGVTPIVGDIISEWDRITRQEFGGPVPTLVFSPTVAVGEQLVEQWEAIGHQFGQVSYVDGAGPERQARIEAFRKGHLTGLISVDALARGFDVPGVRLIISARAFTRSLAAFIQQVGRGMRAAPGKADCVLLDHVGNWTRLGPRVRNFWAHGWNTLSAKDKTSKSKKRERRDRTCPECRRVFQGGQCPECGWEAPTRLHETAPGRLEELTDDGPDFGPDPWGQICRMADDRFHGSLRAMEDPELPLRWAKAQFRSVLGSWPPFGVEFTPSPWAPHPTLVAEVARRRREWARARKSA